MCSVFREYTSSGSVETWDRLGGEAANISDMVKQSAAAHSVYQDRPYEGKTSEFLSFPPLISPHGERISRACFL